MCLAMLLNNMTDITEGDAGLNKFDSLVETFLSHFDQALRMVWHVADTEHLAGIAMETILDNSDINIDDVSGFQGLAVTGDAVTNHVINRSTDGFRKAIVVKRCRNSLLHVNDMVVADFVEFASAHSRLHMRANHFQNFSGQFAGHTHLCNIVGRFNVYCHRFVSCSL